MRTSSVCHSEVISARINDSYSAASAAANGSRSRCSRYCAIRRRFSSTVRRATSVGCAVNTGTIRTLHKAVSASSAGNSRRAHAQQSSAKRPRQRRLFAVQFSRAPPPLAMIGFREVRQLKINGERFGHAVGVFHFQPRDRLAGLRDQNDFRIGMVPSQLRRLAIARAAESTGGGVAPPLPVRIRPPAPPALCPATFPANARPAVEEFPWRHRLCPRRVLPAGRIDRPRSTAARCRRVPCHIMKERHNPARPVGLQIVRRRPRIDCRGGSESRPYSVTVIAIAPASVSDLAPLLLTIYKSYQIFHL